MEGWTNCQRGRPSPAKVTEAVGDFLEIVESHFIAQYQPDSLMSMVTNTVKTGCCDQLISSAIARERPADQSCTTVCMILENVSAEEFEIEGVRVPGPMALGLPAEPSAE